MIKTTHIAATTIILMVFALTMTISAGANPGGVTVTPILPDNQDPQSMGFFDLIVTPGQSQDLFVTIRNDGNVDVSVLTSVYTATTNSNGIIDYSVPGRTDESLRHDFNDIAVVDQENITIPAGGSADLTVSLDMPYERFDGILLGAISVIREPTEEEIAEADMFINRYNYVIAVRLRQSDAPVESDFLLGITQAELFNGEAAIVAEVRNPQPKFSTGVIANAQIYLSGNDTPVFERTGVEVDFAPNSVFPFILTDAEGFGLQAGNYTVRVQLHYDDRNWEFDEEFVVLAEEAEMINAGAVNQQAPPEEDEAAGAPGWAFGAIAAGAALIAAIVVLILLIRKLLKQKRLETLRQKRSQQIQKSGLQKPQNPQGSPVQRTQPPQAPRQQPNRAKDPFKNL